MVFSPFLLRSLLANLALFLTLFLTACGPSGEGGPALSGVTAESPSLNLQAARPFIVSYHIGQETRIGAFLEGPDGKRYDLRKDEARIPGDYQLRLDGGVEIEENGLAQRRVLPDGPYRITLQAPGVPPQVVPFTIRGSGAGQGFPEITDLNASPRVISPNFDARDDVSTLNWRTSRPATVTVSISGGKGFSQTLKTTKNQPAQEDKVEFNGLDQKGDPLPDGVYTYTIQAADQYGNITRRANSLEVQGGGRPQAVITSVNIAPSEIILGNVVTITVRVKNTGKVPIRSQGPESGYSYSTREVYSSIENGKFDDRAGFWRIGVDYDANSGSGGAARYPFRWGFGEELPPGQEVEITGLLKVERNEKELKLYVGLIQEKIALVQDRQHITTVKITY